MKKRQVINVIFLAYLEIIEAVQQLFSLVLPYPLIITSKLLSGLKPIVLYHHKPISSKASIGVYVTSAIT